MRVEKSARSRQNMSNKDFEQLDDDVVTLERVAGFFLASSECIYLTREDKEDVLQWAKYLLFKKPFDPNRKLSNGKPATRQGYFNAIMPTALKMRSENQKLRTEAISQAAARNSKRGLQDEDEAGSVSDPLDASTSKSTNVGGVLLFDMPGMEGLRPAPWKVRFLKETQPFKYISHGTFVPYFVVEPKNPQVLAVATHGNHRGKRRLFGKRHLPWAVVDQLDGRRTMMGALVRELIPIYLSNFGFKSLDRKYWTMIADINKRGWSPVKIQAKRGISHSAYYSQLYALRRRGWLPTWCEKRDREILRYFPAYDRCKSFYSDMMLDMEEDISVGGILDLAGPVLEDQLYKPEPSDSEIRKELRAVRKRLLECTRDFSVEEEYDRKIRKFIVDFIERPIKTEMPLEEIEARFRRLPIKRRLVIFCEAIRLRCSIYDVLDLEAAFADQLYNEEGMPLEGSPTLDSVFEFRRTLVAV